MQHFKMTKTVAVISILLAFGKNILPQHWNPPPSLQTAAQCMAWHWNFWGSSNSEDIALYYRHHHTLEQETPFCGNHAVIPRANRDRLPGVSKTYRRRAIKDPPA